MPLLAALRLIARSWLARVAVRGHSMLPTLRDGDWLLVDPEAYGVRPPLLGELVLVDTPTGLIIKRVAGFGSAEELLLAGDALSAGRHDHTAAVPAAAASGKPWFRYWPPRRISRLR